MALIVPLGLANCCGTGMTGMGSDRDRCAATERVQVFMAREGEVAVAATAVTWTLTMLRDGSIWDRAYLLDEGKVKRSMRLWEDMKGTVVIAMRVAEPERTDFGTVGRTIESLRAEAAKHVHNGLNVGIYLLTEGSEGRR